MIFYFVRNRITIFVNNNKEIDVKRAKTINHSAKILRKRLKSVGKTRSLCALKKKTECTPIYCEIWILKQQHQCRTSKCLQTRKNSTIINVNLLRCWSIICPLTRAHRLFKITNNTELIGSHKSSTASLTPNFSWALLHGRTVRFE